jgi:GT2 family glycosyltransferase
MNRVAVIVLNYKGISDTVSCLAALREQTYTDFKVIAIENGSRDTSVDEFKKLEDRYGDRLQTLYNQKNLGFAGGVNTGIRWSLERQYEYIVLLNNDAIPDKEWLGHLVKTADSKKEFGIVTSLLLHEDGKTIDSTGEWYSKWGLPYPRNRDEAVDITPASGEVFGATGGASLYRVSMLKEIGLFDERFFAYYEDVDISFRAQLAGWKVYYESKAIAYHKQGATSSKMGGFTIYQAFKNLPLVYVKNVPKGLLSHIGIRFYTAYWLMYFQAVTRGDFVPATKGLLQSIWYGILSLRERRSIQKNREVPVSYIKSILWPDLPPVQPGLRKVRSFFIGK